MRSSRRSAADGDHEFRALHWALCTGVVTWRWGLDRDVHLLADVDREGGGVEGIDDLEHPCIDTFGALAGKRSLWQDVGLDTDEREGCSSWHCCPGVRPRRGASGRMRQASFSSTSTRMCSLEVSPMSMSGVLIWPAEANSPGRALTCRIWQSTGARTVRRSSSVWAASSCALGGFDLGLGDVEVRLPGARLEQAEFRLGLDEAGLRSFDGVPALAEILLGDRPPWSSTDSQRRS